MQLLSNRDVQAYRLDSWARAIGVLRSKYPDKMTNAHEDQIFEYLYGEGSTNARLDKNTILIEIEKQLEDMMFTPDKPLLIKGAGEVKTGTRGRSDTAKIQEKLDEAIRKMKEAATTEEMEHWKAKVDKYTKDIQDIIDSQTTLFSFPDPRIIKLWYNLAISTGRFVYKDLPKIVQQQGKKLGITRDNFHQKFRELGRKFSKLSSNLKAWWKKVSKHIKKWMKDNKTQEGHIKPGIVVHEMARRKAMRIVHGLQKGLKQAGKHTDQTLSAAKKKLTGEESLADVDDMDKIMSYIEWLRSERKGTATTPEERETLDKKALLKEQKKRKKYLSDNNLEKGAIKAIRKWGRGKKKTYQFNFTSLEKTIEDLVTNELKKLRRDLRSAKTPEHKAVLKERIELLESHDPGKEFIELKRDQEVYVRTRAFPMTATLEKLWSKVPRKDKLIIRQIIEQGVETVEVPSLDKYGRETTTEIRRPAMEGLHPHTEAFIMWWDKARDQIHRAAVQQGLIEAERKIKDYFPLVLNETVRQTLRKGDPKWADAVNHVLGQLQARGIAAEDRGEPLYWTMKDELGDVVEEISYADLTYEHAEEFLTNFMNRYRNGGVRKNFMEAVFKGSERHYIHSYPLELSRDRILPEWAYEDDATHVLHTYIHSTWETISYAKFFEKQIDEFEYEKTDEIYKQFLNYGFPEEDVKTLIQAAMRLKLPDAYRAKAVRMAKNLSIVLLGPQTTIKNYTDLSKAFAYTDMRSVLFSTIKLMFHPPSRRLAQAMIGSKAVFSQELEEGGISGNFARLWTKAILFTMSERHVRKIQGLSAIHYAEVMLKRYKPNRKIDRFNKQARRRFEMWGVDIDAAKARGRLSRQEKMRIGNLAVMQMQPTSPLDKPLTWETKEHMQKWSIYRSFGFKHLKYVKDYAIKQEFMKNGNPRPMLRFIISAHVMGMGMRMILDFLFPPDEDKQRKSEDAVMQYINAVLASGQLGIVGDMMNSTRFAWYSPSVYNTILGPYYGSVIDGVAKAAQSAYNLAVGKSNPFRPIKKFSSRIFARKIPFIGREVEKEFVGEKKSLSL
jgi:hypothetical protein